MPTPLNDPILKPVDSLPEFQAPRYVTDQQLRQAEKHTEDTTPTFGEALGISVDLDSTVYAAKRAYDVADLGVDYEYRLPSADSEEWKTQTKGIDPSDYHLLSEARSPEHFQWLADQVRHERQLEGDLMKKGWSGMGIRMLANVTDPGAIALAAATNLLVAAGVKASLIKRALKLGAIAAGENVVLEEALRQTSATRDVEDVVYAGLAGFLLGAPIGALTRGENAALRSGVRGALREMETDILKDAHVRFPDGDKAHAAYAAERSAEEKLAARVEQEHAPAPKPGEAPETPARTGREMLEDHMELESGVKKKALDKAERDQLKETITKVEAHAKAQADALEFLSRAKSTGGTIQSLGEGITVAVRKKGEKSFEQMLDELPPEVRRIVDGLLDEDGAPDSKAIRSLERLIEDTKDEVKALRKQHAVASISAKRAKRAAAPVQPVAQDSSVGSAAAGNRDELLQPRVDAEPPEQVIESPYTHTIKGLVRWDVMGRLKSSDNPWVRWLGGKLGADPVRNRDANVPVEFAAEEYAKRLHYTLEAAWSSAAEPAFRNWIREAGGAWHWRLDLRRRREFFEQVTAYRRGEMPSAPATVRAANDAMTQVYRKVWQEARASGVEGFDRVPENADYLTRIYDYTKLRELEDPNNGGIGTGNVIRLIQHAILKAQPDLDVRVPRDGVPYSRIIAEGMMRRLNELAAGIDPHFVRTNHDDLGESFRLALRAYGMPEAEIEKAVAELVANTPTNKQVAAVPRAKPKLLLDESASMEFRLSDGSTRLVRFSDMLESDADVILKSYIRQMSGYIGLAQKGFHSRAEFDAHIEKVRAYARGTLGKDEAEISKQVDDLEFLWDSIVGRPIDRDPNHWLVKGGRAIRSVNFITYMGQAGWAASVEVAQMLSYGGLRAFLKHVPELKNTVWRAKSGQLDDAFARELEIMTGLGTEWVRSSVPTRWDESGWVPRIHLEQGLHKAQRYTAALGGLTPVTTILHRMVMKVVAQRFVDMALTGNKAWSDARIRTLGLSDEMLDRILTLARSHADVENGKVKSLRFERWMAQDSEAATAFNMALFRFSRRIIQENDVGASTQFLSKESGKLLFQFRSFMLQAWTKQFQHGLSTFDPQVAMAWSTSMFFGALAYIGQSHMNAAVSGDREAYLEKRMTAGNIAAAAFQRAGFASILPATADTVWTTFGSDKPIFAYGRTTGLPSDFIKGVPVVAELDKLKTVAGGVGKSWQDDYSFSKQHWNATAGLLPNLFGLRAFVQGLGDDLPQRPTSE